MKVISKTDTPNQLTKGKSYEVITKSETISIHESDGTKRYFEPNFLGSHSSIVEQFAFFILNDSGAEAWYLEENFLSLQEHRKLNIDNLLQDDKQF